MKLRYSKADELRLQRGQNSDISEERNIIRNVMFQSRERRRWRSEREK